MNPLRSMRLVPLRPFWGLLAAGFILRVLAAVLVSDAEMWEFRIIAANLVSGHGYAINLFIRETHPTAFVPPAYTYLVAGTFAMVGDTTAARIFLLGLNCLVGTLSAMVIYLLGRETVGTRAGWIAAALWLLFPTWIFSAARFHTVILYTAGAALVTWLILRQAQADDRRQARNLALAAGLAAGVMCLFRGEYPLVFTTLCGWVLVSSRVVPLPRRLLAGVLALSMMGVVLLPWVIRNYATFQRIIPVTSSGGYNLWRGHNPDATGTGRWAWGTGQGAGVAPPKALLQAFRAAHPQADAGWELYLNDRMGQLAREFIRDHPRQELILAAKKLFYFWGTDLTHPFARSRETARVTGA